MKKREKSEDGSLIEEEESEEYMTPPKIQIQETISDIFNMGVLERLPRYTHKRYTDALYKGQTKKGKRHGVGIMKYSSGRQYEGHWENDYRTGEGFEYYSNGNTYRGLFAKGKAHGKGEYNCCLLYTSPSPRD